MATPAKQTTTLDEILNGAKPKPVAVPEPEPEIDAVMEALGPCAWCFTKPTAALDIEDGPKPVETLQYVYLSIRSVYEPGKFTFLFGERGGEQWRMTVTGRNLRPVYDRIAEKRIRRIRTAERDFGQENDKEPFITSISVMPVEGKAAQS